MPKIRKNSLNSCRTGALAVGSDVIECFDMIDTLSKSAQIYLQARAMGFEPEGLTDEQSEELRKAFRLV